jgi:hypothetical protein
MPRDKTTITLDRAKAERARALLRVHSTSEVIDIALDRLIRDERINRDVEAYRAHPPGTEERAIALRQPRRKLDDDDTDWEAFYASRGRKRAR